MLTRQLVLKSTFRAVAVFLFSVTCVLSQTCGGNGQPTGMSSSPAGKSKMQHYNIVLMGATGSLATKYIWNALFTIFSRRYSKESVHFQIYAASRKEPDEGRKLISRLLLGLIDCGTDDNVDATCIEMKKKFTESIQFQRLKTERDFQTLSEKLYENTQSLYGIQLGSPITYEQGRLIYMAIPPSTYSATAKYVHMYLRPKIGRPWMRVVLEKPFGRDIVSARALATEIGSLFDESELYRIDHYLGKTVVKEILPFRYINRELYEPLWNRNYIEQVDIVIKEREDVASRTSFYDSVGVIRDVMQNHLTEMLSLIALELPTDSGNITSLLQSKVRVLREVRRSTEQSVLVGQYSTYNHDRFRELNNNMTNASLTPTFAAALVFIDNKRWRDVPFVLVSGKKLDEKTSYVRIRFRDSRFCLRSAMAAHDEISCKWRRQLVFRIGSTESPSMIAASHGLPKPVLPRFGWTEQTKRIPDADKSIFGQDVSEMVLFLADFETDPYVDLIEAVMEGARHQFVPTEFLLASWNIWTPAIELTKDVEPRQYMGLAKDSERLDFFITRNGGHCGLKYWVSEQNIVQHGSEAAPSSTTSALPKIVQIPAMFRNSTLVTGSQHEVVRRLVAEIERLAHDRVAAGAEFSLALSGGQTSGPLYDALAESSLPWHHVHIWMVDERCDGSNFAVFEQRLLSRISGLRYRNIHPMPVELGDQPCSDKECLRGDEIYEKTFRKLVQGLALDFIVLGVGPDGHTASLFPGEAAAKESKRLVVFTQAGNAPGSDLAKKRMTLTLPAINAGRNVAILVVGSQKHEILQRISNSDGDDIENQYPIVDVKPHAGSLTWYVDNGAMTGID